MAYADYDLTFNEILNQIQNGEGGERNPISLRIYLTKIDSATGKSVTNGHAVTAISYIKTTSKIMSEYIMDGGLMKMTIR